VMLACGRLTLNRHLCRVDAFVFEEMIDGSDRSGAEAKKLEIEWALNLYQGSFLYDDQDARWAVNTRERLRRKFVLAIGQWAQTCELSGDPISAIRFYLRGIDADELEEEFYRGLMRCHMRLGRRAEAMSIFRQLRQTLSVTLGIGPSSESTALFESLRNGPAIIGQWKTETL